MFRQSEVGDFIMILCFSGTGNSRYIAKKIAAELQDEIVDVNAKIKAADYSPVKTGENVIVVTPTYAWRIPRIVSDWLSKTKLLSAKRIWFVMNCGSEIGNASKYNSSLAERKHLCYMGTSQILMPENYIAMFDAPQAEEARKIVKKYVPSNLNTKERAFVLFRYLTEHCSWQLNQSTEAYKKNYGNEAYAALVLKKAACSGYARAYKLLCEAAGIPVSHVNAGNWTHQWNEIKANGKWIKVDAYGGTFADTTGIRKSLLKENKNKEQLVFKFVMEEKR